MPELPEAEANRRRVEAETLNRTIEGFDLNGTEHMDLPGPDARRKLEGHQFTETRRHGKMIFVGSKTGPWIAVHLGMTGSLRPFDEGEGVPDHAKFVIRFEGDRRLAFVCPRKFGWIRLVDDPDETIAAEGLGPDALEIGRDAFAERVGSSRGAVKSALLDQKKLAGVGNLWSDEALFQTGTLPDARADRLSGDRVDALWHSVRDVLARVCDENAVYSKLPDDWLIRNRTEDADCPRCNGQIAKRKVGGRTAYFCSKHQAEP